MVRHKAAIKFDREYLNEISQDESACVNVQKCKKHLALHPKSLTNTNESIKQLLNRSIGRFDKDSDGIILGYQNIALVSEIGVISNDNPFVHIDVEAEFFVFKAKLGQVLHGTVNRVTEDHVGCLVHKTFNVSLFKPHIDEEWIGDQVDIGYEVLLRITFTKFDERLPHIRAEFVTILNTGTADSIRRITQNTTDDEESSKRNKIEISNKYKKQKANKHLKFDEDVEGDKSENTQESNEFNDSRTKTSRKNKWKNVVNDTTLSNNFYENDNTDFNENNFTEHFDEENTTSKKSKKKSKHSNKTVDVKYSSREENEDLSFENMQKELLQNTLINLMPNLNGSDTSKKKSTKKNRNSTNTEPENIGENNIKDLINYFDEESTTSKKSKKKSGHSNESIHLQYSNSQDENEDLSFEERKNKLLQDTLTNLMPNLNESDTAHKKSTKKSRNSTKIDPEYEDSSKNLVNYFDKEISKDKKSKKKKRRSDEAIQNGENTEENGDLSFEPKNKLLEDTLMSLMLNLDDADSADKKSTKRKRSMSEMEPENVREKKRKKSKSFSLSFEEPNHYGDSISESIEKGNSTKKKKKTPSHEDSLEEERNALINNTMRMMLNSSISDETTIKKSKKKDFVNESEKHEGKLNGLTFDSSNSSNLFNMTDSRIKSKDELRRLSCNKKFDLPPDSDLENILNGDTEKEQFETGKSRKKRKSCSLIF